MTDNYFITGATGFLGKLIIENILENSLGNVYGLIRDKDKAEKLYGDNAKKICFIEKDLNEWDFIEQVISKLPSKIDYIIHTAAVTKSSFMVSNSMETSDGIVIGTRKILELAKKLQIKSMVYLSSMEVYGDVTSGMARTKEDQLGNIDILSIRSCYPLGKRMAEHYCSCSWQEYKVPVKIARMSQVFGRGILPGENRVFAQFAESAIMGKDIVLHTDGNSMGNYVDSDDAIKAILYILKKGKNGEAYNVVNEENTMTIKEMAELVADKIADGTIKVTYDIPEENQYGYASKTGLRLSGEKLKKLGWQATVGIEDMYKKMVKKKDV